MPRIPRESCSTPVQYAYSATRSKERTTSGSGFLRQPTGASQLNGTRSLRISSIPTSIGINDFRYYLENWRDVSGIHVLALSLVPDGRSQVATVCFRCEPEDLSSCTAGRPASIAFNHGEITCQLTIDCDFFGMTPLYSSPEQPVVE